MNLSDKVERARKCIRTATRRIAIERVAVAWTGGKDSTVLLHIIRELHGGLVPYPVFFNDSTFEFPDIYRFINRLTKAWRLRLVRVKHLQPDLEVFSKLSEERKLEFSRIMKINTLHWALSKYGWRAFLVAIRRDEHPSRKKEVYVSSRGDHLRIHPLLDFTEKDIWEYIRAHRVPVVSLYKRGYRSLGEMPFTRKSSAKGGERSGREPGKELMMEELRRMGYW